MPATRENAFWKCNEKDASSRLPTREKLLLGRRDLDSGDLTTGTNAWNISASCRTGQPMLSAAAKNRSNSSGWLTELFRGWKLHKFTSNHAVVIRIRRWRSGEKYAGKQRTKREREREQKREWNGDAKKSPTTCNRIQCNRIDARRVLRTISSVILEGRGNYRRFKTYLKELYRKWHKQTVCWTV